MIRPLCMIGIHHPVWTPINATIGGHWTPPVRKCRHCGHLLGRTHRD